MEYNVEKEKREAIEAGQRALNNLHTARENLNLSLIHISEPTRPY